MKQQMNPSKGISSDLPYQHQGGQPFFGRLSRACIVNLALLLLFTQVTFAQESFPILCGALDEADCEILKTSQEVMQTLSSATSQIEMHMSASDVPDIPGEFAVDMSMDMSYEASPELLQLGIEMQQNMAELMTDETAFLEMYTSLLGGISQDLQLQLTFSPDLIALLDIPELPLENGIAFHMLMDEGVIYFDMSSLGGMIPELGMFRGWMGVDLSGFSEILAEEMANNPALLAEEQAISEDDMISLAFSAGAAAGLRVAMENPELIESAVEILRLDDEVVQGMPVAVFQTDIDYATLFSEPAFLEEIMTEIISQMKEGGFPESELPSEAEVTEAIVGIQMMAPVILEDLNLTVIQLIGLDDFYTYSTEIYLDWDLAAVMMVADGGDASVEAPFIVFDAITTYSNFDDIPEIVGPEGAVVLSLEMLMQLAEMQ